MGTDDLGLDYLNQADGWYSTSQATMVKVDGMPPKYAYNAWRALLNQSQPDLITMRTVVGSPLARALLKQALDLEDDELLGIAIEHVPERQPISVPSMDILLIASWRAISNMDTTPDPVTQARNLAVDLRDFITDFINKENNHGS